MIDLLIVEDENLMREYLREVIDWERIGFHVAGTAANGSEALPLLEQQCFNVVLADIRMPVMDGLELARCVRRLYPVVAVVLMTAYGEFEYAREAIKVGVTDFLLKSDDEETIERCFVELRDRMMSGSTAEPRAGEDEAGRHEPMNPVLARCLEFIQENYSRDIGLAELAWHTRMHEKHISRLFSRELHKSFSNVLLEKRLDAAKLYLTMTDLRIYEIAELTGYKTSAYFTRRFREQVGISPVVYRRNHRGTS